MRKVKSQQNFSTELRLIELFKQHRIIGWRRNYKLIGKPDFVFPKAKAAVFTDGCFWHGHLCRTSIPATNRNYWERKIGNNMIRDKLVNESLKKIGWQVVRIWECELKIGELPKKLFEISKL